MLTADTTGATSPAAAAADEALRLVYVEPRQALDAARAARDRARAAGEPAAESRAERARGLAARELNEMRTAVSALRRATAVAERAGLAVPAAEARMSLALVLAVRGHLPGALHEVEAAGQVLGGLAAARLQLQVGAIAQRSGRFDDALAAYRRALPVFRQKGDRLWEAKLLNNRGVVKAYRGRPQAAETDFRRSERLYATLGQDLAVADVQWNRGFAAGRAGAVTAALGHFADAERYYRAHDVPRAALLQDHCEVLLLAGLHREARQAAEQAVEELTRRRMGTDLAEARLMLARVALAAHDPVAALAAVQLAQRAFARQHRPAWLALARYLCVCAAWTAGRRTPALLSAAIASGDELAVHGWTADALDVRLIAARVALALNRPQAAEQQLRAASGARWQGQIALRVRAWHAEALLRQVRGDRRGTRSALLAGLNALDRHRATLGATDLRVRASEYGRELASIGLALAAQEHGDARGLLAWAERCRTRALLLPPVRPPDDPELATHLAALRAVVLERDQAIAAGSATSRLVRQQAALERAVRERLRRVPAPAGRDRTLPSLSDLPDALGDRALVELVEWDGAILAVVIAGRRATVHPLGPSQRVGSELAPLRFGLRRLAGRRGTAQSQAAARLAVAHAARGLDRALLAPLRDRIGDRELVVVPTGALHALPWPRLPTCAGRPVSVAPSAVGWLRAHRSAALEPAGRGTVFVAGPGLPGGRAEVLALSARYPGARCLVDRDATVDATRAALDGAGIAHIAAHGDFRTDNPLFSALALADGPLTVYDLETLERAPRMVLLPACDSGLSAVQGGDELMGLAAALLGLGTRVLVACVVPVNDDAAAALMLALYARLGSAPPARALAQAQAAAADGDDATSFVCYGAG